MQYVQDYFEVFMIFLRRAQFSIACRMYTAPENRQKQQFSQQKYYEVREYFISHHELGHKITKQNVYKVWKTTFWVMI